MRLTSSLTASVLICSLASFGAAQAGERPPAPAPEMPSAAPQRPDGVQVWVCQPPRDLTVFDTPAQGEKKLEIDLIAPRNGRASGQVVLASAKAIRNIRTTVGDLAREDGKGTIPSGRVLVRFPAVAESSSKSSRFVPDNRFDVLLTEAPAEVPVRSVRPGFPSQKYSDPPVPVGAMQPVWLTVLVPADAAPGVYRAEVTVSAEGLAATKVPLGIKVYGWTMPDLKDLTCRPQIWQSQESSARRYGAPLWSERHFELMGQVLDLIRPTGNGLCPVHLIANAFNAGNAESMVRWIDKGNGKYEHDFAPFDRYLDLYEKKLGKPRALLLNVFRPKADGGIGPGAPLVKAPGENPVKVSRLDPATGRVEPMSQPFYGTDASADFWRPVLAEVSKRLEKRGWLDVAAIGTAGDAYPTKETATAFLKAAPKLPWFSTSHKNPSSYKTVDGQSVPVAFREHVWGVGSPRKPEYAMPWKTGGRNVWVWSRYGAGACILRQHDGLFGHRFNPEIILHTGWAGLGQSGADYWFMPDTKRPINFSDEGGGMNESIVSFVAPGPGGPLGTERLEAFAEGMQVVEALVCLLKAVDGGKLDAALAARCQDFLAKRAARNLKIMPGASGGNAPGPGRAAAFLPSWQEDDDKLFSLCAEIGAGPGAGAR